MKTISKILILIILTQLAINCGDVPVTIDEKTYVPKIVVDGYLMPETRLQPIRLTRNYPLNTEIQLDQIFITDADVTITDLQSSKDYILTFAPLAFAYQYAGHDFKIDYGKSYKLTVKATIDGKKLSTNVTTTVPAKGFMIVEEASKLQPLQYRERDGNDKLKKFTIAYKPSPGTDSYIASIVALEASDTTFIEENPFVEPSEIQGDENLLNQLKFQSQWALTQAGSEGLSRMEIEWFSTWFYGKYRLILYAADKNFTDYFLTHSQIQDIDGNLWEPKFHFEGDGIGVFGAAIPDTVYFEVLRE